LEGDWKKNSVLLKEKVCRKSQTTQILTLILSGGNKYIGTSAISFKKSIWWNKCSFSLMKQNLSTNFTAQFGKELSW
jgi:hypothetical protein